MKERPIIFKYVNVDEMIRAILSGRKTQTRIPIKLDINGTYYCRDARANLDPDIVWQKEVLEAHCPFGVARDRLWVREAFNDDDYLGKVERRADYPQHWDAKDTDGDDDVDIGVGDIKWKPSTRMPREYSRITLEIVNVRVERVQEINEENAMAEGIRPSSARRFVEGGHSSIVFFERSWNSIYGKGQYAWDKNPWVWVIEFKKL